MTKEELEQKIAQFIPEGTTGYVVELLIQNKIQLRLTKPRSSKYGDYRAPNKKDNFHRISINKDLNPFSFIITFLHEVAHLTAFVKFGNTINPHGKEWKEEFRIHLKPIMSLPQLPFDIRVALASYINNPAASSCTDKALSKVLAQYDTDKKLLLENIPEGSKFRLDTGRVFIKGKKLRTWYQCFEQPSNKIYSVSGISKVELV